MCHVKKKKRKLIGMKERIKTDKKNADEASTLSKEMKNHSSSKCNYSAAVFEDLFLRLYVLR